MAKVDGSMMKGKADEKALEHTGGRALTEREQRDAKAMALAAKGFDALAGMKEAETLKSARVLTSEEKNLLIDVPFAIVDAQFRDGDMGPFVSCTCVLKGTNEIVILNDGSTGIMRQLEGKSNFPIITGGLRRSDYKYKNPDTGKETPATTFYLKGIPEDTLALKKGADLAAQARRATA